MNVTLQMLVQHLERFADLEAPQRSALLRESAAVRSASDDDITQLLAALDAFTAAQLLAAQPLVAALLEQLSVRARTLARDAGPSSPSPADLTRINKLYNNLQSSPAEAWAILGWLAALRGGAALRLFAELFCRAPQIDTAHLAVALAPLFQHLDYDAGALFPTLLDALADKHLANAVLDLANYLTREKMLPAHPAQERAAVLIKLLGELVQRLGQIEDEPDAGRSAQEVGEIIAESLPLAVSLCDALAQIGNPDATGKLYQAMELRHRRLRTEAAAALAHLGEKAGADILVELAAEPVARLRVLAYAQELGMLDRIDEQYTNDTAQAESRLALWLAQPAQFGIPPTSLELIDEREQYWPSYDEPVQCYLFRFVYNLDTVVYANIGIAGPLEHAFGGDLADLPPDDIYAAFAGWHVEHEDLREYDVSKLNDAQRLEVTRLKRRLHDAGLEAIVPHTLALFFGERVLIATGTKDGQSAVGITTDTGDLAWLLRGSTSRPLGPHEAYCMFKGRRLLRTFNG